MQQVVAVQVSYVRAGSKQVGVRMGGAKCVLVLIAN